MTADQRLNQLEPLLAQNLAVSDRHTAQLQQLASLGAMQSDNIAFVIQKTNEIDDRLKVVEGQLQAVDLRLGAVEGRLGAVEGRLGAVEGRLGAVEGQLQVVDGKLDQILGLLLSNGSGKQ